MKLIQQSSSKLLKNYRIKKFMITGEISGFLEESIDLFDKVCKNYTDEDIPMIMEIIFDLYIPLIKILSPKENENISLYKRIMMSLYKY